MVLNLPRNKIILVLRCKDGMVSYSNNPIIDFTVNDRPPKKSGGSIWSSNQAKLVLKLRKAAFDAMQKAGLKDHFSCPVKLELVIFAPNITKIGDHTYVGDLDTYIAGVCESLYPANSQVIPHEIFEGNYEIDPKKALIINDDSQIISVKAEKVEGLQLSYRVSVIPITS